MFLQPDFLLIFFSKLTKIGNETSKFKLIFNKYHRLKKIYLVTIWGNFTLSDDCVGSYGYDKLNDTHAVDGVRFGSSMSLDDCKVVKIWSLNLKRREYLHLICLEFVGVTVHLNSMSPQSSKACWLQSNPMPVADQNYIVVSESIFLKNCVCQNLRSVTS